MSNLNQPEAYGETYIVPVEDAANPHTVGAIHLPDAEMELAEETWKLRKEGVISGADIRVADELFDKDHEIDEEMTTPYELPEPIDDNPIRKQLIAYYDQLGMGGTFDSAAVQASQVPIEVVTHEWWEIQRGLSEPEGEQAK